MNREKTLSMIFAAVLILGAGAFFAGAETIDVEVEMEDGSTATVDVMIDGESETFTVENLADGEERTFEAGDHSVVVRRSGNAIDVFLDGDEIGDLVTGSGETARKVVVMAGDHGAAEAEHVFVSQGGTKVKIIAAGDGKDIVWHGDGEKVEEILIDLEEELAKGEAAEIDVMLEKLEGDEGVFLVKTAQGVDPLAKVIQLRGEQDGMVTYRCKETGSELRVKEENATFDSFVDPASGCLLEKVEEPEEHVMIIKKRVVVEED